MNETFNWEIEDDWVYRVIGYQLEEIWVQQELPTAFRLGKDLSGLRRTIKKTVARDYKFFRTYDEAKFNLDEKISQAILSLKLSAQAMRVRIMSASIENPLFHIKVFQEKFDVVIYEFIRQTKNSYVIGTDQTKTGKIWHRGRKILSEIPVYDYLEKNTQHENAEQLFTEQQRASVAGIQIANKFFLQYHEAIDWMNNFYDRRALRLKQQRRDRIHKTTRYVTECNRPKNVIIINQYKTITINEESK